MASRLTSKSFPGFDNLYYLSDPVSNYYFRADLELNEDAFQVTRREVSPTGPVVARWGMGRKEPSDIVWTTHAIPIVISERVVDLLRQHEFVGWSTYDVELYSKTGDLIPGYFGLSVSGRCGPIDNSRSIEFEEQMPARMATRWRGLFFEENAWDGSDLFMPEGNGGWKFVTEEVREVFKKAKIKNVTFTPLSEVVRSYMRS